jgi:hypothetical protein
MSAVIPRKGLSLCDFDVVDTEHRGCIYVHGDGNLPIRRHAQVSLLPSGRTQPICTRRVQVREEKENAMSKRLSLMLCSGAFFFLTGVGFAQQSGTATGPAAGTNAEPSTAIQKQQDGASGPPGSPAAAGHPGVEAKPGTEGGKTPEGGSKSNEGEQRAR